MPRLPNPPPPPSPRPADRQGAYFLLTGTTACRVPPPVPGHCYTGYGYDQGTKRWLGPESLAFLGADLELGQLYFTMEAPRTSAHPTAFVWKWLHGPEWSYLGEMPAFI